MTEAALAALVLRCADLEATADFYRSLGLTLTREQHGSGPEHWSCYLGGVLLELYPGGQDSTGPRERLTFRVGDRAQLFTDPDGRRVEVQPI